MLVLKSHGREIFLAAALMSLAGCEAGNGASADGQPDADSALGGGATDMPSIFVDQIEQVVDASGMNGDQTIYRDALEQCTRSGWPIVELDPEDLERIGTRRYRMLIGRDREAHREESWRLLMDPERFPAQCRFEVEYNGTLEIIEAGGQRQYDLATGEEIGTPGGEVDFAFSERFVPVDRTAWAEEQHVLAEMYEGPRERTVAGHPCLEWELRATGLRTCMWSGGMQWGFVPDPAGERLILDFESSTQGERVVRQTQRFELGGVADSSIFEPN